MTQADRWNDYFKRTANPFSLVSSAASAGLGQWRDRPEEWGQGAAGFGRRYASSIAQHVVKESLMFAASSALHEDNRYVRSQGETTRGRIVNAIEGVWYARRDDGSRRVSISRFTAYAGVYLISRTWQPPTINTPKGLLVNVGTSFGLSVGMNVVREFWPRKR
jgi:hypothetical protein